MSINLHKLSFYLDTNIINYAYDYATDYWEHSDELPNIMEIAKYDKSNQINEYIALQLFQVLTYWNEFIYIIGDRMVEELDDVSDDRRRSKLISHALRIKQLHTPQIETYHLKQFMDDYQEDIHQLSLVVGAKDSLLICEAIKLNCDYFLTTDGKLTSLGDISEIRDIEITSPQRFIGYVADSNPNALYLESYDLAPDISRLSILIPEEDED